MAEIYVQDPDLTILCGDVRDARAMLPENSVDCIVTSPPYWGLRDYGELGQVGLESTPEEYVEAMVEIFGAIHDALSKQGTLWLNLGDTYSANRSYQVRDSKHVDVGNEMASVVPQGLKPKDLVGIPWRVALALQAAGWYLRSDIIWHKPNPMPESITDRPTKSHEYIFLLSKNERYFFDQEAVREPAEWNRWGDQTNDKYEGTQSSAGRIKPKTKHELMMRGRQSYPAGGTTGNRGAEHIKGGSGGMPSSHPAGRNIRTVWSITTQPYADAHFATFPIELPRRAIAAGCPHEVCTVCGVPRTRILERESAPSEIALRDSTKTEPTEAQDFRIHQISGQRYQDWRDEHPSKTVGWTDCGHNAYRKGVVLDPFFGSGTTGLAARELERNCIGIDINRGYCEIAAKRLQQLSLFSGVAESADS